MRYRQLYLQDNYPVFQNRMYPTALAARGCEKGTVQLVEDSSTGLVYNVAFDPTLMRYDENYQNEQAHSSAFLDHLGAVKNIVLARLGNERLVEIGCGKATFLEMLQRSGAKVIGCDPTYEGTNPAIEKRNFSSEKGIDGANLVLRHVLEHIPDPVAFLAEVGAANGGAGLIYIEVPCLDWVLRERAWFDIYYEHVNYFRLGDFDRMFGSVVEKGRLFGGQYLYVVADLATLRRPVRDTADPVVFPDDFTSSIAMLNRDGSNGSKVIWGGASKGVIFALLAERAGHPVDRVIDINPGKQGKYLAATGLRVQSPEDGLAGLPSDATLLVMNPNYLNEIRVLTGDAFKYVGVGND